MQKIKFFTTEGWNNPTSQNELDKLAKRINDSLAKQAKENPKFEVLSITPLMSSYGYGSGDDAAAGSEVVVAVVYINSKEDQNEEQP